MYIELGVGAWVNKSPFCHELLQLFQYPNEAVASLPAILRPLAQEFPKTRTNDFARGGVED